MSQRPTARAYVADVELVCGGGLELEEGAVAVVHDNLVAIGEADALLGAAYVCLEAIGLVVLDLLDAGGGVSGAAYHVDEGEADALMLRLCGSVYIFAA